MRTCTPREMNCLRCPRSPSALSAGEEGTERGNKTVKPHRRGHLQKAQGPSGVWVFGSKELDLWLQLGSVADPLSPTPSLLLSFSPALNKFLFVFIFVCGNRLLSQLVSSTCMYMLPSVLATYLSSEAI